MRRFISSLLLVAMLSPAGFTQSAQTDSGKSTQNGVDQQGQASDDTIATFSVAVSLVQIDVRVVDRAGKPITGLKPDQFMVSEDGKPQKISGFDFYDIDKIERAGGATPPVTVRLGSVAAPQELTNVVRDHRLIVLFFDLTSMQPDELLRAQAGAEKYLREQISPADLVAIVTYGNQLKIPAHFTNNHELLLRSVRALRPGKESNLAAMAEAAAQPGENSVSEETGAAFTADDAEFNIFNTDRKLAALESLSSLLRDIPGRKLVVQFTGGITQTGDENRLQLRATTDAANRANVSYYTVDARGLFAEVPGGEARSGSATGSAQFTGDAKTNAASESSRAMFTGAAVFHQVDMRHASRETLATLANDTGGRPFFDLGDLSQAFRKLQSENSSYYLLGYYSTNRKRDGRWRSVRVNVNVPGAHVQYREGYYAPQSYGMQTQDKERQLIEALRSDVPRVEFPIALETSWFRISDTNLYVPISAKLGAGELQWAMKHGRRQASFDFAAEVRDASSNRIMAALRDTVTVQLDDAHFKELQQRPLLYQGGVVLGPGHYRLKFVARENESGRIGMFGEELVLPSPQPDALEVSSVFLSSQLEPVREEAGVTKRTLGPSAKLKVVPTEVSGERLVPSVTRVLTRAQNLYVLFQAYAPKGIDAARLRAGLAFFRDGQWASEVPLVEPTEVNTDRIASFRFSIPLTKFNSGTYVVQAVAVDSATEQVAFAQNSLTVRDPANDSTTTAKSTR